MKKLNQTKIVGAVLILFVVVAVIQGGGFQLGGDLKLPEAGNWVSFIRTFAEEIGQSWHPWTASFWQVLTVLLAGYAITVGLVNAKIIKEEGGFYYILLIATCAYVMVGVVGVILRWIGGLVSPFF